METQNTTEILLDVAVILYELNRHETTRLLPLIVYLTIISIIGVFGNAVVCYIYKTQYTLSNSRYFILCLSVIDLFSCCFVMPFEILTVLHQYDFQGDVVCKLARFINTLPTVASGFMFLVIAIDRHRKVCKPFGWQISPRVAKWVCAGTIFCGLFFSWPALLLYGVRTFPVPVHGVNATECSIADSMQGTIFPFINNATFGFLFMVGSTSLVVLFSIIGHQISKHSRDMRRHQGSVASNNLSLDQSENSHSYQESSVHRNEKLQEVSLSDTNVIKVEMTSFMVENSDANNRKDKPLEQETKQVTFDRKDVVEEVIKDTPVTPRKGNGFIRHLSSLRRHFSSADSDYGADIDERRCDVKRNVPGIRQHRARRISFLMFLISLAYILSYLPHVLLMLVRAVNKDFVDNMSDSGRATYKFFLRSYAMNSVVNPFIYSACDRRFRRACSHCARKFFRCSRKTLRIRASLT